MSRPAFALNVLLASLLLSSAASAAGYQLKVSIPNLPPAVWPSCTTPWGTSLAHNGKVFAYSVESVPAGSSCDTVKQERTCNKGVLSGTYSLAACTVVTPPAPIACTAPWGATVAANSSVTAFNTETVQFGNTCVAENRTCTNGTLSGTFTHAECTVGPEHKASCKAVLAAAPVSTSGLYTIDPDGHGPVAAFSAYCDMASAGGGWTRVVQQYEATPVTAWTGGSNGAAYTLTQDKIPAHTEVGFGRDTLATYAAQVTMQYSVGNIPLATVTGPSGTFQVHRDTNAFYSYHDPEQAYYAGESGFNNTLTLNRVSHVSTNGWSFTPGYPSAGPRGFAMSTYDGFYQNDTFAWTVWVR